MKQFCNRLYIITRRFILKIFVPEYYWPEFVEMDGVPIPVRGMPYSFGTKTLLKNNNYETAERKLLKGILQPGDRVVEMGSSIGVLSRIIAGIIGEQGILLAIEASATLFKQSSTWVAEYPNIKLVKGFAFPVYQLTDDFTVNGFDEIGGSLGGRVSFLMDGSKGKHNETLYDLLRIQNEFNIRPRVLVIDIESSELIMLTCQPDIPFYVEIILIEFHPDLYPNGATEKFQLIDVIEKEGFVIVAEEFESVLFARR